jgi:hypothetical protein
MISQEFPTLNRALSTLGRCENGLQNLHPLWDEFVDEFYQQEINHFAKAPWADLSEASKKQKAKQFPGKPLLRATDALFKSLTEAGQAGGFRLPRNLSLEIGTRDPKAAFHQEGTNRMPARPPLAEPDLKRYETIAGQYVAEMIERAAA